MFNINWLLLVIWIFSGGYLVSFLLAPFVLFSTTKKIMTIESKAYAGILTTILAFFLSRFFGLFYLWLILINLSLWFLLPMWWKIEEQEKIKILIIYIGTNLIAQTIVWLLFSFIELGI